MAQTQSDKYNYGDKSIDPIKFNYLTIAVVGDSLTEQTERGPSWVQLLGEYVRVRGPEGTAALSAGIGGSTFESALTNQIGVNLQSSQADIVQSVQPDLIFVCMGFNDIFNSGFSASKVITDADALFTRLRADNPEAHIVYIEELAYDRTNIPGDVIVTGTPIGLTNKNLLPFLQEGQNLYGLSNVYDTSSDFLDSVVSTTKHEQVQNWIDVTAHIKAQSYIDSSMIFDMFFLSRCGMHTDLIHLDRYGYKMFALDARKHIVDTPEIIGGESGKSENLVRFGPIKSTSDTVNPNLLKGTEGLRSAFTVSGSGVNASYLYQEDFAQVGFVNHDSYDFPTRQFIWPLLNRNLRVNTQGRLIYRNDPFEFEGQALIPNSDVYIQYDNLAAQLSTQPILQNCSIKVQEPFNSFFPTGDFTPGNHLVALGFGYDNGRTEFYRKVVDIVNDSDRPGSSFDPSGNNNFTGINTFNGAGFGTSIIPGGGANNALLTFATDITNTVEGGVVFWESVTNTMNIGRTGADGGISYNLKLNTDGRATITGSNVTPQFNNDLATKSYVDSSAGGFDPSLDYTTTGIWTYNGQIIMSGSAFSTTIKPGGGGNAVLSFSTDAAATIEAGAVYWVQASDSMNLGRTGGTGGTPYNLQVNNTGRVTLTGTSTDPVNGTDVVTKAYGDANYGGGGGSFNRARIQKASTESFSPGGGVQTFTMNSNVFNSDPTNLITTSSSIVVSASSSYTEFRVKAGYRITGTVSGEYTIQATINGQLPSATTFPLIFDSRDGSTGTVGATLNSPWMTLSGGGDSIDLRGAGVDGGTIQSGNQVWLEVEVR